MAVHLKASLSSHAGRTPAILRRRATTGIFIDPCRHDQEADADAEKPGQETNGGTRGKCHLRRRRLAPCAIRALVQPRADRRGDGQRREQQQKHRTRQVRREGRPGDTVPNARRCPVGGLPSTGRCRAAGGRLQRRCHGRPRASCRSPYARPSLRDRKRRNCQN